MYTVLFVSPTGINAAAYVSKKSPVSSPYSYQMQNRDSSYSVRTRQLMLTEIINRKKNELSRDTAIYRQNTQKKNLKTDKNHLGRHYKK